MQAHSKCLITDYLLTIELRTVYNSQSGILIKDIAAIDYREKDGGCTPYRNALRNNRCLPINGSRTRIIFNTHVMVARNVLVPICLTATTKKPMQRTKSMAVSSTDAQDVTLAIP